MVAIRRVKYIVKLSALSLVLLTFVIFLQWDEISYRERVKRYVDGLKGQIGQSYEQDLLESERDLDVDEVLQKIKEDVNHRLRVEENARTTHTNAADKYDLRKTTIRGISTEKPFHPIRRPDTQLEKKSETSQALVTPATRSKARRPKSRDQEHRRHVKRVNWKPFPWKPEMRGQLNVHVWQAWCGSTIHDLRRNWFFPSYPDLHLTAKRFFIQHFENDYGQRVFGYIHPPLTGRYVFALSSDDSSEFWLSSDENPENVRLLAWVGNRTSLDGNYRTKVAQFTKYQAQLSEPVFLKQGNKYFVEALHKQGIRDDHILVGWKIPGFSGLRFITGDSISMYINDTESSSDVTEYAEYIPQTAASHSHARSSNIILDRDQHKFGSGTSEGYNHMHRLISRMDIRNIFPKCAYSPSYLVHFRLSRYDGVKLIHDSAVYPNDNTELTHMKSYDKCLSRRLEDSHGNALKFWIPRLSNDSLYEDGEIRVLSHGDGVSVVSSPDEWDNEFRDNAALLGNKSEDSQHQSDPKQLINEVYGKVAMMNKRRIQTRAPVRKDRRRTSRTRNQVGDANNSHNEQNIHKTKRRKRVLSDTRDRHFAVRGKRPVQKNPSGAASATSAARVIRKRKGRNSRNRNFLREKKRYGKSKTKVNGRSAKKVVTARGKVVSVRGNMASLRGNVDSLRENVDSLRGNVPSLRGNVASVNVKSRTVNKRPAKPVLNRLTNNKRLIQLEGDKGHPVRAPLKPANRNLKEESSKTSFDSARDAMDNVKIPITRRKLLSVENFDSGNKYQDKSKVPLSGTTDSPAPQMYFRPFGTYIYPRGVPPAARRDVLLSRILMAREFVRRMQRVVQHYRYTMTSKQVSEQVFKRFGIRMIAPPLFPVLDYNPWLFHHNTTKCSSDGNMMLNPDVAKSVVNRYMNALNNKTRDKYSLRRIINVEENHDIMNGDRYLLELDLHVHGQRYPVRLSQYIYQKTGQNKFCLPHNFKLNEHATVHVIVPVKNQGRWVQYFIDDMSELYLRTGDPHLNVIIVDFASTDIDIKAALERSALRRYKLIRLQGAFQRAFGIHAGSTYVKNPHDIIFMCDLHLELPNNMIDIIRKHTVEGRMAFAPIVTRLHCGFTPAIPFGFWELQGYGLFAIYQSDFIRVGGMNYREFGTRWGGEDWELLDRVLTNRMEVERLRIPNFYHFYHSKKGMWGTPTIYVTTSNTPQYYSSDSQIIPIYEENEDEADIEDEVEIQIMAEGIDPDQAMDTDNTDKGRRQPTTGWRAVTKPAQEKLPENLQKKVNIMDKR